MILIRKSKIQPTIDKAVECAERNSDAYWRNELTKELNRQEKEMILEIAIKEAEIKIKNKRIAKLEKKIKEAEKKYYIGKALIKKARYIVQTIHDEMQEISFTYIKQAQSLKALQTETDDAERNLLIENKEK
jgi:hypothetical protein